MTTAPPDMRTMKPVNCSMCDKDITGPIKQYGGSRHPVCFSCFHTEDFLFIDDIIGTQRINVEDKPLLPGLQEGNEARRPILKMIKY